MSEQHKVHIERLEKQVSDLRTALANLSSPDEWTALIGIIHRPGWTSVAEEAFVSAILDSMHAQTAALTKLKGQLLEGSKAVVAK